MRSERGGRAAVIAPSALGSKDHPPGPSKAPLRKIRSAVYPPGRIRLRNVEGKVPWRVLDIKNLPRPPSVASRNEVWEVEGVSTFSLGGWSGDLVSTRTSTNQIRKKMRASTPYTGVQHREKGGVQTCGRGVRAHHSREENKTSAIPFTPLQNGAHGLRDTLRDISLTPFWHWQMG